VRARRNAIVVLCALSLSAGAAVAAAAEPSDRAVDAPEVKDGILERPVERLYRTIETSQGGQRLEEAYRRLVQRAEAVGVNAPADPLAGESTPTVDDLDSEVDALREKVRKAEQASATEQAAVVSGVPSATLEAIAACESGGDPTAVSADGTYRGKYQFDTGTWASVGGSGDPAAAPEAEQDYRAALLYQRSGPSAWPVCG
jgi:soluble lytic murein transglycosylase-like protein